MKTFSTPRTLAGVLAALAAATLAPSASATAASPYTLESAGTVSLAGLSLAGPTTLEFLFAPGAGFAPAELVGTNFSYTGDWAVDTSSLAAHEATDFQGHLSYTYSVSPAAVTSVTLYNNGTPSTVTPQSIFGLPLPPLVTSPDDGKASQMQTTTSVTVPFSSIGSGASFDFQYFDAPTTATFSVLLGGTTVLAGGFSPNGAFTPTTAAAGVSARFTPLAPAAVPEAPAEALLALGALPLLGLARARRAARA